MSPDQEFRRSNDQIIGKLVEAVDNLKRQVEILGEQVLDLKSIVDAGRGALWGISIASGGAGAILTALAHKLLTGA